MFPDVELRAAAGGGPLTLHGPCAALAPAPELLFRGVPVPLSHRRDGGCEGGERSVLRLSNLASSLIRDGCRSRPRWRSAAALPELTELALAAMPQAAFAFTPSCNLDDHWQLLHALTAAVAARAARSAPRTHRAPSLGALC